MDDQYAGAAHCPNCGAEYRKGFEICADCGAPLEPGPAPAFDEDEGDTGDVGDARATQNDAWAEATERAWGETVPDDEEHPEPVVLCRLPQEEAHLLVGRLQADGIEAMVSQGAGGVVSAAVQMLEAGRFEVLVRKSQLQDALEVVRAVFDGRYEI